MSTPEEDDDPVIATFNVFLNPSLPSNKRLLALANPLRRDESSPGAAAASGGVGGGVPLEERDPTFGTRPHEVRLKPGVGAVEVDVPRNTAPQFYDRRRGVEMGTALKVARDDGAAAFFGEGGGLSVSAPPPLPRRRGDKETELGLQGLLEWEDAVRSERVLSHYTMGGKLVKERNKRREYMVAIVQGDEVHLTPLTSRVHLHPEKPQISALRYVKKQNVMQAAKEANPNAPTQSRAIQMTIKTGGDNAAVSESPTAAFRAAVAEPWRRMRYVDENSQEAWDMFQETLVPLSEVRDQGLVGAGADAGAGGASGSGDEAVDGDVDAGEGSAVVTVAAAADGSAAGGGSSFQDTVVTDLKKVPKLRTHLRAYHVNHRLARGFENHYENTEFFRDEQERIKARAIRNGDVIDVDAKEEDEDMEEQKHPVEAESEVSRRGRPRGRGAGGASTGGKRGGRGGSGGRS